MRITAIRAAIVIAAVYGYFLIFAQFAFVELVLAEFNHRVSFSALSASNWEKTALGAMALAGILSGFVTAWKGASSREIRVALLTAALVSALAPFMHGPAWVLCEAILTGVAIGVSTVALAPLVRSWCGLFWVGLGTGIGYASCNLPWVFSQSPSHQAWIATAFALAGAACVPAAGAESPPARPPVFSPAASIILFTALVWLDSAAFFIIQHDSPLKSGTWGGSLLWRNAAIHLVTALAAGAWLARPGANIAKALPLLAWLMLAAAATAVNKESSRSLAGWLYPSAVSLYSVALVAWPAWFSGATTSRSIGWSAAWLYAVAGWFGSANGIGMAQSLRRVPQEFIAISGTAIFLVLLSADWKRWRSFACVLLITACSFFSSKETPPTSAFDRGKQVYLSEGCIHCHSRYVRPGTRDEEYWGPARATLDSSRPVLIGNRRQGPDLAGIGTRRSPAWLREHFINPGAFSPGTSMPSYQHLFEDTRGPDLVAYLSQSGADLSSDVAARAAIWTPRPLGDLPDASTLFSTQCAICHGPEGKGNGIMAGNLARKPANLADGPFVWTATTENRESTVQRIIKYGIPGTDMPGHETLDDAQVVSLARYLIGLRH